MAKADGGSKFIKRWYDCDEGRMFVDVKLVEEREYDKLGRIVSRKVFNDFSPIDIWKGWIKEYLEQKFPEVMFSPNLKKETRYEYKKKDIPECTFSYTETIKKEVFSDNITGKNIKVIYEISPSSFEGLVVRCEIEGERIFWINIFREEFYRKNPKDVLLISYHKSIPCSVINSKNSYDCEDDKVSKYFSAGICEYHEMRFYKDGKKKNEKIFVEKIQQSCYENISNDFGGISTQTIWNKEIEWISGS